MSITFLTLPTELRLKILKLCLPTFLACTVNSVCKQLYTESNDNEIWNQWLIKSVPLGKPGKAKAEFAKRLNNVLKEAHYLHPLYNKLVKIQNTSTLDQLVITALENAQAGYLIFLHSRFRTPLTCHTNRGDWVEKIAQSFPETAALFFEKQDLIGCVIYRNHAQQRIFKIAKKAPDAFFKNTQVVEFIYNDFPGEDRIYELACEAEGCIDSIATLLKFR